MSGVGIPSEATAQVQSGEGRLVTEFGTGLLRTSVHTGPDGLFVWRRTPGELARPSGRARRRALLARLRTVDVPGSTRPALAEWEGDHSLYLAGGTRSAATRLLRAGPGRDVEEALRGLGELLREIHRRTPAARPPAAAFESPLPPPALSRLSDWFGDRAPTPRAAYAGASLRRFLGTEHWERLLTWHRWVLEDESPGLVHGAPGLGNLVLGGSENGEAPGPGTADLLVGDDLAVAPWYFDLGWILGELIELKWYLHGDSGPWQRLTEALFAGYGTDLGDEWNRMAALRTAVHLHDYIAYVGWNSAEVIRYSRFLRFLIDL